MLTIIIIIHICIVSSRPAVAVHLLLYITFSFTYIYIYIYINLNFNMCIYNVHIFIYNTLVLDVKRIDFEARMIDTLRPSYFVFLYFLFFYLLSARHLLGPLYYQPPCPLSICICSCNRQDNA